jgi:hypothetical protein
MKRSITEKQLLLYIKHLDSCRQDLVAQICLANASINKCETKRHRLTLEKSFINMHLLNDECEIPQFDSFNTPDFPKRTLDLTTFVMVEENDPLIGVDFSNNEYPMISLDIIDETIKKARAAIDADVGVERKKIATKLRELRSQLSDERELLDKAHKNLNSRFKIGKILSAKSEQQIVAINERILPLIGLIDSLQSQYSELGEFRETQEKKITNWKRAKENLKSHDSQIIKFGDEISQLRFSIEELVEEYEQIVDLKESSLITENAADWLEVERERKKNLRIEKIENDSRMLEELEKAKKSEKQNRLRRLKNNQKRLDLLRKTLAGVDPTKIQKQITLLTLDRDRQKKLILQYKEDVQIKLLQISKSKNPLLRTISGHNVHASSCDLEMVFLKIDLPSSPSLHNLCIKIERATTDLSNIESSLNDFRKKKSQLDSMNVEVARLEKVIRAEKKSLRIKGAKRGSPPTAQIENWEEAENFAELYMRWLGFSDSQKTASGSDLGKDIDSIAAVAQVKDMGTGVSRPMVQQLFGVASAEKKIPIFFARSYAKTAIEWSAEHDVALFQFNLRGEVKGLTERALKLIGE